MATIVEYALMRIDGVRVEFPCIRSKISRVQSYAMQATCVPAPLAVGRRAGFRGRGERPVLPGVPVTRRVYNCKGESHDCLQCSAISCETR
jgi:hypothetical protein